MRGLATLLRGGTRAVRRYDRSGADSRYLPEASQTGGYRAGWASGLAVAVLSLILTARVASVLAQGAGGQVPFTVALFVLPVLYAVPGTRALLGGHRWLVLAVQVGLTWVPFAVFGGGWQEGIGGLLAGLVLLVVPGWASWLLAGGLLTAEVVVRAVVIGLPVSPAWYVVIHVAAYYADDALLFFGLVRMGQIVGQVAEAQGKAAGLAVAGERLEAARSLQAAVGQRLAGIAAKAAAAQRAMGGDVACAREQIAAAGIAARDAVAQAREVTARQRDAFAAEPATSAAGGAVIGARLAQGVLVAVLTMLAAVGIGYIASARYGAGRAALAVGAIVLATVLQLHHSGAARNGRKPRAWPVTLALQAVLAFAFLLPFLQVYAGFLGPLLAGSILLLVPGRWRWIGFAAALASYSALYAAVLSPSATEGSSFIVNVLVEAAVTADVGLTVYGLAWLAGLAAQLEGLNRGLARMAVVQERLRIARDVHDLLGLGLSAIALKADLIARLIGRDDARATAEIGEMGRICASARAEIRLVTGDSRHLSLASELAAARQILSSAGIEVQADVPARRLPAAADEVLAPVLREAVTNVLRHSSAGVCMVEVTSGNGALRLRVSNDGAPDCRAAGTEPGSGLANLTARVHAAGGQLTSRQAAGGFDLVAEIPVAATPS